jgi:threonine dehydrogenase-like Zn-dependent dehydrogenase
VPMAHFGPVKVPEGPPDERFLFLSDVLPTAWQAVEFADVPEGGSVTVFGLGPIGQMAARIARHRGARVIAVDLVRERIELARRHDIEVLDLDEHEDIAESVRELTDGRGTDSVIDAVGMEAHGAPAQEALQTVGGMFADPVARKVIEHVRVDRLAALTSAIETVRRGGTISISGVYGGTADPINMMQLFDKGVQLRMGQAHVRRWTDKLLPLVLDDGDPLGVLDLTTHRLPLDEAPHGYEIFQKKQDGAIKVVLQP